jgi:hypothetical protein
MAMWSYHKLFIYDAADEDNREQAEARFDPGEVHHLPCRSLNDLIDGLDRLKGRNIFKHVLFQTHGSPGRIIIGSDDLYWSAFHDMEGRYDDLFPYYTFIYFDGCNVAADLYGHDVGVDFLISVGGALLRQAGGETFAWTNPGYGFGDFPFIGGHTVHLPFTGNVVRVYFGLGGRMVNPS